MALKARLDSISRPFWLIWLSVRFHYAALKEAIRNDGPTALLHPQRVRDQATAKLFITTSNGFIAYENTTRVSSLVRSAHGKILELGPGAGNQIQRYDHSLVEYIYAIDPNPQYRDHIAAKVISLNLQDKYKLLTCGIEDSEVLRREGITEGSMDTILSMQVMCSVRDVKSVMREVWKLLKPGGSFMFWEHEKSKDTLTAVAQTCLNPAWSTFIGCSMSREILADILAAGEWENPGDIEMVEEPYNCLPRIQGVLRKKA